MSLDSTQRFEKSGFEKVCDGCGCKFHVEVSVQEGSEDTEEYNCPNCGKAFSVKAAMPPSITPLENCGG